MSDALWRSRPDAFAIRPATEIRRQQINDFIWLSESSSNVYLVVTSAGRVVINAGIEPERFQLTIPAGASIERRLR